MLDGAVAKTAVGINITANGEISAEHAKCSGNAVAMAAVSNTAGGVCSIGRRIDCVVDSGVTHHILADAAAAKDIKLTNMMVTLGDGSKVQARGVCTVDMVTVVGKTLTFIYQRYLLFRARLTICSR
jgi:hypothetical protein